MLDRRAFLLAVGEVAVSAGAVALTLENSPGESVASATAGLRPSTEPVEPIGGSPGHPHGSSDFAMVLCTGRSALAQRSADRVNNV